MALSDTLRIATTPHLEALLAEVDELARGVANAPAEAREPIAPQRLLEAATATLTLDGADPDELPDLDRAREVAAAPVPGSGIADGAADGTDPGAAERPGTWLDAMGVVGRSSDTLIRALELLGAVAALASDDLAATLTTTGGVDALRELHRRATRGLVPDDAAGEPRRTDQAVHDASVGRIVYSPVTPERVGSELDRLGTWLATDASEAHPVVAAGVLHAELLRIHPFESANGRVARTAARLLLRAGGLDPDGLGAPETVLALDPMGYHQAMADTVRRRDSGLWVERWAEAVAAGLRASARSLDVGWAAPPARAVDFVAARAERAFTLADYLEVVAGDRAVARSDLRALLDAGTIDRVLGAHGLRYTIRAERNV